jgi:hypothetical protein
MSKQKRSGNVTAGKSKCYYGECQWIWVGTTLTGRWYKNPTAILFGIDCKHKGRCVDPNKLGIKGHPPIEFLIMYCKAPKKKTRAAAASCDGDQCYCQWTYDGSKWVLDVGGDHCGNCGANCACIDPNGFTIAKKHLRRVLQIGIATTCVTFCHAT